MKIIVGRSKAKFYLAPNILRKSGDFFKCALKKDWREGQERTIELPGDEPRIFRLYADWLSAETIVSRSTDKYVLANCDRSTLIDLYVYGEKMLDRAFQDKVIDAIRDRWVKYRDDFPRVAEIDRIFNRTLAGSPIRALAVDQYVLKATTSNKGLWMSNMELAKDEFILDLLAASLEQRAPTEEFKKKLEAKEGCAYHHHDKDTPCQSAKANVEKPAKETATDGGGAVVVQLAHR